MKISFLMMAKNTSDYLPDAIRSLQAADGADWELIIVDDHSDDQTRDIAMDYAEHDSRIRVFRNPYSGVVRGTSFAFEMSQGDVIKCIDSDDVMSADFFRLAALHAKHDLVFHSASVVSQDMVFLSKYFPNQQWLTLDYRGVAQDLISLPKWCWSFSRDLGEKIFPLPEKLPIEDIWMSLLLKKFSVSPIFVDKSVYSYRQHNNQIWGGILNYERATTIKRSTAILGVIDVLEECDGKSSNRSSYFSEISFAKAKAQHKFLLGEGSFRDFVRLNQSPSEVVRGLLLRYFPLPMPFLASAKWYLKSLKRRLQ